MTNYVLDMNIITELLRQNKEIIQKFHALGEEDNQQYLGCPFVYYEIKKGLLAEDKKRKMQVFESIFKSFRWIEYTEADWVLASGLWALRRKAGRPIEDADLLIGVFAFNNNATLVTNNTKDFDLLGVSLEDWSV